jgi:phage shock protein PspC (stress-responsive transcriptional regulator)
MRDIYQDFYRSADDKKIAGVCSGLAHKMNLNTAGLRFAFFLLSFWGIGLIIYVVLWLVLKGAPTKDIALNSRPRLNDKYRE